MNSCQTYNKYAYSSSSIMCMTSKNEICIEIGNCKFWREEKIFLLFSDFYLTSNFQAISAAINVSDCNFIYFEIC